MYSVILLSGGKGNRMQETMPKQYLLLAGKPMIMHTIERLDNIAEVGEIVLVCDLSYEEHMKQMLQEYNITKPVVFVKGGETRQGSVYNGLTAAKNELVLIHEAARPFVKQSEFQRLIEEESSNVMYGYSIPYTVVKGEEYVSGVLNRSELINVQLPQKFNKAQLLAAHHEAQARGDVYTEDASMLYDIVQCPIKVLHGTSYNIKITEPIDMLLGEIIYKNYIINRD